MWMPKSRSSIHEATNNKGKGVLTTLGEDSLVDLVTLSLIYDLVDTPLGHAVVPTKRNKPQISRNNDRGVNQSFLGREKYYNAKKIIHSQATEPSHIQHNERGKDVVITNLQPCKSTCVLALTSHGSAKLPSPDRSG